MSVDRRWHGWPPCPLPAAPSGAGPWLELSHTLRAGLSRVATFPEARFERLAAMPRDPMNATTMLPQNPSTPWTKNPTRNPPTMAPMRPTTISPRIP